MSLEELKDAIDAKTVEFETAMTDGKPNGELMVIYRQLKELKYQLAEVENLQTEGNARCQ